MVILNSYLSSLFLPAPNMSTIPCQAPSGLDLLGQILKIMGASSTLSLQASQLCLPSLLSPTWHPLHYPPATCLEVSAPWTMDRQTLSLEPARSVNVLKLHLFILIFFSPIIKMSLVRIMYRLKMLYFYFVVLMC